jgi:rSAM/selenodomain-associated transferase 1
MSAEVVVYGRQPVPGRVKTRLAATIGERAAAAIYECLLEYTVAEAIASGFPVTLSLAAAADAGWCAPHGVRCEVQPEGTLGGRMAATFAARFAAGAAAVVLVGSDCAALARRHIVDAASRCAEGAVVLGPATDGGYYLVAQRQPGIDLFSGVPWSSPETLAATRSRIGAAGGAVVELEPLRDVDTAEDLRHALADPRLDRRLARCFERALAAGTR